VDPKEREGVLVSSFRMGLLAKISWSELLRLVIVPEFDVAEISPNVSNPAQNGRARSDTLNLPESLLPLGTWYFSRETVR